jgi:uncharacterized protein
MPLALTDRLSRGTPVEGRFCEPVPVGAFPRLAESLLETEGAVLVDVRVSPGPLGAPLVEGRLSGRFRRECQRCLDPVDLQIDVPIRLAVTASGADELAPAGFEPWQSDESEVVLRDLLEDELLLALPMVARHDDQAKCGDVSWRAEVDASSDEPSPRESPFAVLRGLKQD